MTLIIEEIIRYLKENVDQLPRVEEIAEKFNYSKYYFSREFKRVVGVSLKEFMMALKIERSLAALLQQQQPILKTQLLSGYLSSGTFSATFVRNTGISPRNYRQGVRQLFEQAKAYENDLREGEVVYYQEQIARADVRHQCQVRVQVPTDDNVGLIFIGLFRRPIPNHRPVAGVALRGTRSYIFNKVPPGTYYVMTCAIKKSDNPLDYFLLQKSLRAQHYRPVTFPIEGVTHLILTLREARVEDPPILFNFVKLLGDILIRKSP